MTLRCPTNTIPLSRIPPGVRVLIQHLPGDEVIHRRLLAMGVQVGSTLEVLRRGWPWNMHHVACGVMEFMLSAKLAEQIGVLPSRL